MYYYKQQQPVFNKFFYFSNSIIQQSYTFITTWCFSNKITREFSTKSEKSNQLLFITVAAAAVQFHVKEEVVAAAKKNQLIF